MGGADLHTHTTASDGALAPAELVLRARDAGLEAIAITDHDTVEGVPQALEAGLRFGVEVVPGVEINTDVPGTEVHMLGYFLDLTSEALHRALRNLREGRLRRAERMVAQLQAIGVPVEMARVLEIASGDGGENGRAGEYGSVGDPAGRPAPPHPHTPTLSHSATLAAVGRPHVARALIEMGAAANVQDAFDRYLGRGMPGYVPRSKFTPEQAIALIREARGVPVLAHPALSGTDSEIPAWVRAGMRGLEVDHSDHADEQAHHYRELARELGLIATSGSDFHGIPGSSVVLGGRTCGMDVVERLRAAAGKV